LIETNTLTNYDQNATQYDLFRLPSVRIQLQLRKFFTGSKGPILSIGCGTGRLENNLSKHQFVIGLDRSIGMLIQARNRIGHLIQGDMVTLPFKNGIFRGLFFMQSLHHVGANLEIASELRASARKQALREAVRVLHHGSIVIIQRDPVQNQAVWFWKYFPKALQTKMKIQPKVVELVRWLQDLGLSNVEATPVDDPLALDFYEPISPLDPKFRRSISEFSYLTEEETEQGITRLRNAIKDGSVYDVIAQCKEDFEKLGGTVFVISGEKTLDEKS
jgi:ubiquinone/menaquinone biosynthesis C-methylase UbiE